MIHVYYKQGRWWGEWKNGPHTTTIAGASQEKARRQIEAIRDAVLKQQRRDEAARQRVISG